MLQNTSRESNLGCNYRKGGLYKFLLMGSRPQSSESLECPVPPKLPTPTASTLHLFLIHAVDLYVEVCRCRQMQKGRGSKLRLPLKQKGC